MADRVLPLVRSLAAGREADDLLCVTSSGHRLHASAFKRTLAWASIVQGVASMICGIRGRASGWPAELIR